MNCNYRAADHLKSYTPNVESIEESAGDVPPLTEFFEMVHVGDVIQQMVQLYYDEEIASIEALGNHALSYTYTVVSSRNTSTGMIL